MKYSLLKSHISDAVNNGKPLDSVYIVYGGDDYLKRQALRQFKNAVSPDFAAFNYAAFGSDKVAEALEALNSPPVMDFLKVITLTLGDDDKAIPAIKAYIASPIEGSTLAIDCSDAVARQIKTKKTVDVVCSPLEKDEVLAEIRPLLDSKPKMDITPDALDELCLRTQNSMARITGEVMKLRSYSDGIITKDDVVEMVNADLEYQIYTLTDAVSQKNADLALKSLTALLDSGVSPRIIVNNLYDRYRRMLHISLNKTKTNDDFARQLGIKPGAVYYMRKALDNYTQIRLKNCVDLLHELQYDILRGKKSEDVAMHQAMFDLLTV